MRISDWSSDVCSSDLTTIGYDYLVVAPGIALDWAGVDGLSETLGKNGVTSNYDFNTAPYTWELVKQLKQGVALFTQPPMPIKCAGAPQKAMYLSCDRSEEHTSELQSLMRISYAVFCLHKKTQTTSQSEPY